MSAKSTTNFGACCVGKCVLPEIIIIIIIIIISYAYSKLQFHMRSYINMYIKGIIHLQWM
uniref:Uncharacterized protein n=1 Tax=Anguilla anguilla TaxID=7936 RepID=A0A0E9SAH4_ANGAN